MKLNMRDQLPRNMLNASASPPSRPVTILILLRFT
jgi:hypothetical protein